MRGIKHNSHDHVNGLRARDCKVCTAAWQRRWRRDNRNLANRRSRECKWREQGITLTYDEYERLYSAQNGLCAICRCPPSGKRALNVDHNHRTKKVRALLCQNCNAMLGLAGDNPDRLRAGAAYLVQHQEDSYI